jgi:hypothetical protein
MGSEAVQVYFLSREIILDPCREYCGDIDYELPLP